MRFTIGCLSFLGLLAGAAEEPSVRPVGIQVVLADSAASAGQPVFVNRKPIRLVLMFDTHGQNIEKVDGDGCVLSALTDDSGKDLKGTLNVPSVTGKKRDSLRLVVEGENEPSPGTASIRAKGVVKVKTGSNGAITSPLVDVKMGRIVKVAPDLELEVQEIRKNNGAEFPFEVALGIGREIPEVAELRFFDKAGKRIPSQAGPERRLEFLDKIKITRTFKLARSVDAFRVEAAIRDQSSLLEVPFDLTVTLGGAK